ILSHQLRYAPALGIHNGKAAGHGFDYNARARIVEFGMEQYMRLAKDGGRCLLRIRPKKHDAVEDALFDRAMASDPGGLRLVRKPTQFSRDQQLRIDPKSYHP